MRIRLATVCAALALAGAALPASAKPPEKELRKAAPGEHLRYAHSWEAAVAEAKDRGCVIFATFHADG